MSPSRNVPGFQAILADKIDTQSSRDFKGENDLSGARRSFVNNNIHLYTTQFKSNRMKLEKPSQNQNLFKQNVQRKFQNIFKQNKFQNVENNNSPPSYEVYENKNIFYGKQLSNVFFTEQSTNSLSVEFPPKKSKIKPSFHFEDNTLGDYRSPNDNYYSAAETPTPFISTSLGEFQAASSNVVSKEPVGQTRKLSVPLAKSGWTPLDEDYNPEEEEEEDYFYDEYSYGGDYSYRDRSGDSEPPSYIDQLQFQILSSPVDIPKLGVQDDFKPIEVLYNEMFQQLPGRAQAAKQARSLENIYLDSVSWVTSSPHTTRIQTTPSPPPLQPAPAPSSPPLPSPSFAAPPGAFPHVQETRPAFLPTRPTPPSQFQAGKEARRPVGDILSTILTQVKQHFAKIWYKIKFFR